MNNFLNLMGMYLVFLIQKNLIMKMIIQVLYILIILIINFYLWETQE